MSKVDQETLAAFGREVKRTVSLRGMTLDELSAAMSGACGKSMLSKITNGTRDTISPRIVGKLITALELDEGWIDRFLEDATSPDAEETPTEHEADLLIKMASESGTLPKSSEELLILLANTHAEGSYTDRAAAFIGLSNALEAAEQMRQQGAMPADNTGSQLNAVMAEVAKLNDKGWLEDADALLDAEERRMREEHREVKERLAEQSRRLLKQRLNQDRLRNDPKAAARRLVEQLRLDAGEVSFEALRSLWIEWYERGRDGGLAFDALVAIDLARITLAQAQTKNERGTSLDDLGNALATLGERETGTARLDEAVTAFRNALLEWTREAVPLEWAMTQNNLGNALQTLGERETSTAQLDEAVTAYRNALLERTREAVPLDWAATQNNLGNALKNLGERETGTARLDEAVTAYRNALLEYTRDAGPLDWAMTQNNLGTALQTLGERETGTARLDEAVTAYRNALLEWTREAVPLDWAMTQGNLTNVEIAYFDKSDDPAHLIKAEQYLSNAMEVFREAGATQYIAMAENQLAQIQTRRP